jgi:5-methylcytosine-specific restriction endonuclease McrA
MAGTRRSSHCFRSESNVDHVKPLHSHWHLRLQPGNLQTLCALCNHGKGGMDKDWRSKR